MIVRGALALVVTFFCAVWIVPASDEPTLAVTSRSVSPSWPIRLRSILTRSSG